jgi:ribonuclease HII
MPRRSEFVDSNPSGRVRLAEFVWPNPSGDFLKESRLRVAILAGVDEAGYGPVLGPLVVSGVVLDVPDELADACLWQTLKSGVTDRVSKSDPRLAIADSKKLHQGKFGFQRLERTAWVALKAAGVNCDSFAALLKSLAPHATEAAEGYPWYRDFDAPLPTQQPAIQLQLVANAFQKCLRDTGVELLAVHCEPLLEGHFNRLVTNTRNKAVVSLGLVLKIVDRVATLADGRPCRVCVDRQGGRTRYGSQLMTSFELRHIDIVEESESSAVYRVARGRTTIEIAFRTSGEEQSLPCALASVLSKYMRELFMRAFNAYWSDARPDLKPTAGYYQDGHRFINELGSAIEERGVERSMLIRQK